MIGIAELSSRKAVLIFHSVHSVCEFFFFFFCIFLFKEDPGLRAREEEAKRRQPAKNKEIAERNENICSHKNLDIAALFIIAKKWNNPSVHQLLNELTECGIYI